ncbi:MAG: hypothetical protein ACIARR_05345 [Phycisphaerales bacterium JB059]
MSEQQGAPAYWTIASYVGGGAIALGVVAQGAMTGAMDLVGLGALALVVVIATAPIAFMLRSGARRGQPSNALRREVADLSAQIARLGEMGALSDDARRVLNRKRERELLRRAIEEDMASEDWDAAMVLVKELAERFGYRADAEEFRERIETARFQTVDRRVAEAVSNVDRLITQLRWDEAFTEAGRITRLYPDSPRVEGLRHRVERAKTQYKMDLERRFLHAAQAEQHDEALALLKEMDGYLTEAEAEPFQEVARGVIGKARENLGVQFKLAVQDRDWRRALDAGERVLAEFPNTRMAAEIRDMIEGVRTRAAGMG